MAADLDDHVAQRLREVDQRYTSNRREIVRVLDESDRPLTITELLQRTSKLPQSSAYRNLTFLEEVGIVVRVLAADEFARFELSEDLTGHHHHLICTACGAVEDFILAGTAERQLEAALGVATEKVGFAGLHHRLDVVGLCRSCR